MYLENICRTYVQECCCRHPCTSQAKAPGTGDASVSGSFMHFIFTEDVHAALVHARGGLFVSCQFPL